MRTMATRRRWWLAVAVPAVASVVVLGGYALLTEERVLFECTACLASDPGTCARTSVPAMRTGEETARLSAVQNLCARLGSSPMDFVTCVQSPRERFQIQCSRSLQRVPRFLFHVQ